MGFDMIATGVGASGAKVELGALQEIGRIIVQSTTQRMAKFVKQYLVYRRLTTVD